MMIRIQYKNSPDFVLFIVTKVIKNIYNTYSVNAIPFFSCLISYV